MKKEANFIDGVLKEFYYKALDKNIISEEGLSKTASVSIDKYAATGNLMQDLVNLASGLRELGLFEQAESLETKINIFKKAESSLANLIDQESQALLHKAHPSSTKITDAQGGWGIMHTNLDRQDKILQTLVKKNEPAPAVMQNTVLAAAEALGLLKTSQPKPSAKETKITEIKAQGITGLSTESKKFQKVLQNFLSGAEFSSITKKDSGKFNFYLENSGVEPEKLNSLLDLMNFLGIKEKQDDYSKTILNVLLSDPKNPPAILKEYLSGSKRTIKIDEDYAVDPDEVQSGQTSVTGDPDWEASKSQRKTILSRALFDFQKQNPRSIDNPNSIYDSKLIAKITDTVTGPGENLVCNVQWLTFPEVNHDRAEAAALTIHQQIVALFDEVFGEETKQRAGQAFANKYLGGFTHLFMQVRNLVMQLGGTNNPSEIMSIFYSIQQLGMQMEELKKSFEEQNTTLVSYIQDINVISPAAQAIRALESEIPGLKVLGGTFDSLIVKINSTIEVLEKFRNSTKDQGALKDIRVLNGFKRSIEGKQTWEEVETAVQPLLQQYGITARDVTSFTQIVESFIAQINKALPNQWKKYHTDLVNYDVAESKKAQAYARYNLIKSAKGDCTQCGGDGYVDDNDIERQGKKNVWIPGNCTHCDGKGNTSSEAPEEASAAEPGAAAPATATRPQGPTPVGTVPARTGISTAPSGVKGGGGRAPAAKGGKIVEMQKSLQELASWIEKDPKKYSTVKAATIMSVGRTSTKGDVDGIWGGKTAAAITEANKLVKNLTPGPSKEESVAEANSKKITTWLEGQGWKADGSAPSRILDKVSVDVLNAGKPDYEVNDTMTPIKQSDLTSLKSLYEFFKKLSNKVERYTIKNWQNLLMFLSKRGKYLIQNGDYSTKENGKLLSQLSSNLFNYFESIKNQYEKENPDMSGKAGDFPLGEGFFNSSLANASTAGSVSGAGGAAGGAAGKPGALAGVPGAAPGTIGGGNAPKPGAAGGVNLEGFIIPGLSQEQSKQVMEAPPFDGNMINLMSKYFIGSRDASSLLQYEQRQFPMSYFKSDAISTAQTLFQQAAYAKLIQQGADIQSVTPQAITATAVTIYSQFLVTLGRAFTDAARAYMENLSAQGVPSQAVFNTMMSVTRDVNRHFEQIQRWNADLLQRGNVSSPILTQPYQR